MFQSGFFFHTADVNGKDHRLLVYVVFSSKVLEHMLLH